MAAFDLTVAGIALKPVKNSWGEDPPETLGEEVRMADGTIGSTERTPARVLSGDVAFLTLAEGTAFKAAISYPGMPGVPYPVVAASTAASFSLNVSARLGRIQFIETKDPSGADTAYWKAHLTLRQAF